MPSVQPKEDLAYREACDLALAMERDFYPEPPKLELSDNTASVLTQIDNMYAGIRSKYEEQVRLNKSYEMLIRRFLTQSEFHYSIFPEIRIHWSEALMQEALETVPADVREILFPELNKMEEFKCRK